MSVVQPDLKPLARKDLLYHQVRKSVAIDIRCGNRKRGFTRLECQFAILIGREMEPDAKLRSTSEFSGVQQDRSVGPRIIVKVGRNKPLPKCAA